MATLTEFLIALSGSADMREAYQDPARRDQLLEQWGLTGHEALQANASLSQMQQAVSAEQQGGEASIEWWILVNQAPIANDAFTGAGEDPQGGEPPA